MSKGGRWLVPTQKGSEVGTPAMRAPTAVRIAGVRLGSPEAHRLLGIFRPQISHFHRTQNQKYSLSLAENYRAHGVYPGLKMTYTNLQGHETLNIQISPEIVKRVQEEVAEYWDCAVIDVHVPGQTTLCEFAAFMVVPVLERLTPTTGEAGEYIKGVAYDGEFWGVQDPPLAYPDGGDYAGDPVDNTNRLLATVTVGVNEQVSSLRVDLRPFRGLTAVVVDIYGRADFTQVLISRTLVGSTLVAEIPFRVTGISAPTVNYAGYGPVRYYRIGLRAYAKSLFPELAAHESTHGYYDWSDSVARAPYLLDGADSGDLTWFPGSSAWNGDPVVFTSAASSNFSPGNIENAQTYWGGTIKKTETSKYWKWYPGTDFGQWRFNPMTSTSPPPDAHPTNNTLYSWAAGDWTQFWTPDYSEVWENQYLPQLTTVRGAIFKGVPADTWSERQGAWVTYRQWENREHYPARWTTAKLADNVAVQSYDPPTDLSAFNHYGLAKLGRLTIDLVHGGISFKPV